MEGHSFFLQLIAQGCGNLAKEEHLLYRELLLRYFIPCYAILDKQKYYRLFLKIGNDLFLVFSFCFWFNIGAGAIIIHDSCL